ncbi:AT-hook motif nuclear-localized protein 10-like [Andrographis paniculata]|uniref:AT-hook motif nuclear-localized protein 10-like n=1 Tax=Andrographis paniculata TaxID=175694 RepID=UPI0021E9494C|nr:AT-hook motif nuclear-localized protein 10-like [Andrographis paniculata]
MSGVSEATGSREPFAVARPVSQVPQLQNSGVSSQLDQQMGMSYHGGDGGYMPVGSSPPYQSITAGSNREAVNLNSTEPRRKRGRPRKYGPDGGMAMAMASPQQQPANMGSQQSLNFSPPLEPQAKSATPAGKKPRGRPPGSTNKKKLIQPLGTNGLAFTPHVISVNAGEDISSKIMAFSHDGPRSICILSANGVVSNVTLRQPAASGGTATFKGRYDLLNLSGSYMLSDVDGQKSRVGGLSTTLAGPDGRIVGGCVAGMLTAGGPVQVVVGSFVDNRKELKSRTQTDPSSAARPLTIVGAGNGGGGGGGGGGGSSSPSRGTFSESSGGPSSPLNLISGTFHNLHPQVMPWK